MRLAREVTSAGAVRCTEKTRIKKPCPRRRQSRVSVALATALRAQPQICGSRARSDRLRRCLSTPHSEEIRYRVLPRGDPPARGRARRCNEAIRNPDHRWAAPALEGRPKTHSVVGVGGDDHRPARRSVCGRLDTGTSSGCGRRACCRRAGPQRCSSCRLPLVMLPQLADQAREALNPDPHLQCVFPHVDPLDEELDDPCLLGREQLAPDRSEVGGQDRHIMIFVSPAAPCRGLSRGGQAASQLGGPSPKRGRLTAGFSTEPSATRRSRARRARTPDGRRGSRDAATPRRSRPGTRARGSPLPAWRR